MYPKKKFVLLIVFWLLFLANSFSQNLKLIPQFADTKTSSTIINDTLQINNRNNQIIYTKSFNLRLSSENRLLRYTLKNNDSIPTNIIMELTNPFLYKVRFYTIDSLGIKDSVLIGAAFPFYKRQKEHPNLQYEIHLEGKETLTCLIQIETGAISGDFRLMVWEKEQRIRYQILETKYLSYFFLINISFLFLIGISILLTKQRYHWFYFIYALFGFIYIYAEVGLAFKNIWPHRPLLQSLCILLIANIYQMFGLLFVRKYFNTSAKRLLFDKLLVMLILTGLLFELIITGALIFSKPLPTVFIQINTLLFIFSGLYVFYVALTSIKYRYLKSDSIWFMIGFTPHAISILQLCLRPFGLYVGWSESMFKNIAPIYIETIHPPNFLLWSVLWEAIIIFWMIIKRLKRLYEENNTMIEQLAMQREKNMQTLLTGIENERQRIAQELHDGSGVALSALKMKLHVLKDNYNNNPQSANDVSSLMKEVDRIYEDIRNISHNLMPKTLSKLGLYHAIDELVNQIRTAAPKIKFNYYRKINISNFNENAKINIYRMIQELLTNVVKHANANEVSLQLIKHNDSLMISIEDDGVGFDTRATKNGVGLTSIESRVQILNGNLSLDSAPQNGTFISIFLPLKSLN